MLPITPALRRAPRALWLSAVLALAGCGGGLGQEREETGASASAASTAPQAEPTHTIHFNKE